MGYVGLTLAVTMSELGFKVLGVEVREEVLTLLQSGEPHFYEPGLGLRLRRGVHTGRLQFARRINDTWQGSVFVITVGTPLDTHGKSRLDMIERVASDVEDHMSSGSLVILRSTVKIGTTNEIVAPILGRGGEIFELAFCPERTLEGQALSELRQLPQIVSGNTVQATLRAAHFFQLITPTVIRVSSIETAEMIKLVDNAQRDVMFGFANEVARACDMTGMSAAEVIKFGKLGYSRTNLPMPGPVGGPCLEKDSHILAEGLRERGVELEIMMSARRTNESQPREIVEYIKNYTNGLLGFPSNPVISMLGIAFKGQPSTDDLRGTMAKPILQHLRDNYMAQEFRGYDAVVCKIQVERFGLVPVDSLQRAFAGASLVLICNNHPIFSSIDIEELAKHLRPPALIYDFWNFYTLTDLDLPFGIRYVALGSHLQRVTI